MINDFWSEKNLLEKNGIALSYNDREVSYLELNRLVSDFTMLLKKNSFNNKLAFLPMRNDICSVVRYLSCLRQSMVPILLPDNLDVNLKFELQRIYKPAVIFDSGEIENFDHNDKSDKNLKLHANLAILLSTSGSTGSPRLVKLSYGNISSNAASIVEYLNILDSDRALCSLPLSYSYGLSIINSHLSAGAFTYLSNMTPLDRGYYETIRKENI